MELSYKTFNRIFSIQEIEYLLNRILDEQLYYVMEDIRYSNYLDNLYKFLINDLVAFY